MILGLLKIRCPHHPTSSPPRDSADKGRRGVKFRYMFTRPLSPSGKEIESEGFISIMTASATAATAAGTWWYICRAGTVAAPAKIGMRIRFCRKRRE
jgi:hypothetical protein